MMSERAAPPAELGSGGVSRWMVEARAAELARLGELQRGSRPALELALSALDLTSLEGVDTPLSTAQLVSRAVRPSARASLPSVAAVCVSPLLVAPARRALEGSAVALASVVGAFPSGHSPLEVRLEEARRALGEGADELDMVLDRGALLSGRGARVYDEIAAMKELCQARVLKVIVETGELGAYDDVRAASLLAMRAGADFIKTSTGKSEPGARPASVLVMLEAIREHYRATGRRVGIKASGGIRTAAQALAYVVLVRETLGAAWLAPARFRLGASTLLSAVVAALEALPAAPRGAS